MITLDELNELSLRDFAAWLRGALHGRESLPYLTPDERTHLAILRLLRDAPESTQANLRVSCRVFLSDMVKDGGNDDMSTYSLISLAASLYDAEIAAELSRLLYADISQDLRWFIASALADMSYKMPWEFWMGVFRDFPASCESAALSGLMAIDPVLAATMLPQMPDSETMGTATAHKLDLAWDAATARKRCDLLKAVVANLQPCELRFTRPVQKWVLKKIDELRREREAPMITRGGLA